ncbi:MAG: hypothetical protein A3C84_00965 [Candidatus Ryanbacteria bacterium RIFCSPHIGHO2_02_FULL_48_12]|uniref:Uncharacterized protein n=1 Tax=Candidatus Ryanbacteria bacterium RIFCSPHIGHO2_01_FULL_48_27 TaxID=1802115 RepID=A0A1G2G3T7_9BACT|nr:MAG: hypothetical protein A2756_03475 [Candidatus Ryanbacteria bacterium RIFCSPHIGHO2_01_FULL_48_27]OGZ50690.1 MAG: hypothetical protein A3C84_00965 [Candidatus Ryanbacteria bacterium RIFCSPHIGHO2_02_FULL_48_12]
MRISLSTKTIILLDALLMLGWSVLIWYAWPVVFAARQGAEDAFLDARRIVGACRGNGWDACYKKELEQVTTRGGMQYGELVLTNLQDIDPAARDCHVLAHAISRAAVRKDPADWKNLLNEADAASCGSGYLHGVLEAHVWDDPEFKLTPAFVDEACRSRKDFYDQRMCFHFMGHLFLVDEEGKVPPALVSCQEIPEDQFRFECYDGLFMEHNQKLALADHGMEPLPNITPQYLEQLRAHCLSYDGQKSLACWQEMAEMYAKLYEYDPIKVFENCYTAPTDQERKICYFKGIVVTSIYALSDTPDRLLSICKPYDADEGTYKMCTEYIIATFMHYSSKYTPRAVTLCTHVTDARRQSCFHELGKQLQSIVPQRAEREGLCVEVSDNYRPLCVGT